MKNHKPTQRKDGSIYCRCPEFPEENVSVSLNWLTKKAMCSVCGKEVDIEEGE